MANSPAMILCRGHNNPFLKCKGSPQNEKEFYSSRSPLAYYPVEIKNATNGKIHYCKTCVQKIFEYELEKSKDMQRAVYYTCQRLDIPFLVELFDNAILKSKGKTPIEVTQVSKKLMGEYIGLLNLNKAKYGTKIDFSWSDSTLSEVDVKLDERERTKKELEQFKLDWGMQDEAEDYIFLNNTFTKYTRGMEFVNSQQEDLYRDLCRDRLLLRKINDKRYNGDETMDKIQTRIAKIMAILKVDQFESNKPKTFSEESFFAKIAQIELTKPADLYKEPKKYEDFNKLKKYEEDMVLRPLLNTLCNQRDFNIDIDDVEKYNMDDE